MVDRYGGGNESTCSIRRDPIRGLRDFHSRGITFPSIRDYGGVIGIINIRGNTTVMAMLS